VNVEERSRGDSCSFGGRREVACRCKLERGCFDVLIVYFSIANHRSVTASQCLLLFEFKSALSLPASVQIAFLFHYLQIGSEVMVCRPFILRPSLTSILQNASIFIVFPSNKLFPSKRLSCNAHYYQLFVSTKDEPIRYFQPPLLSTMPSAITSLPLFFAQIGVLKSHPQSSLSSESVSSSRSLNSPPPL